MLDDISTAQNLRFIDLTYTNGISLDKHEGIS